MTATYHVTWDRGISLVGQGLWLDPLVVRERAFVSHAHSDHARRHALGVLTEATLALLPPQRRPRRAQVIGLQQPVRLDHASLTLHDAGHMLGSAQLHIEHEGAALLYSGDLKLRHGSRHPDTAIPRADVLVLESTYGRPHFRFPEPDEVIDEIASWCMRALCDGCAPVLLANAVGKAQEVMLALAGYGFEFALEERCVPFARGYEQAGVPLPDWIPLDELEDGPGDRVVIAPPAGKEAIRRLPRYRTALVSGWAREPSMWPRFGADRAFPLSDHCDFDELFRVVELSGAERVYTVHGFATDLARHLRRRGVRAHAINQTEQLTLELGI